MLNSKVPSDLITNILGFLNNKSSVSFIRTCIHINNVSKKHGYVTSLRSKMNDDIFTFIRTCCEHSLTLKTIELNYMDDPHLWIPFYVNNIIFKHCSITKRWNPGKKALCIKKLKLEDYNRYKFKNTLKINWESFENLEELRLYVYDVDLSGIDKLTKLKNVFIDVSNFNSPFYSHKMKNVFH